MKECTGFVFILQNKLFGVSFRSSVGKLLQGVNLIKDDCDFGLSLLILLFRYFFEEGMATICGFSKFRPCVISMSA